MARRTASSSKPNSDDVLVEPAILPMLLQHAADLVIEAGVHAGKHADEAVGRGERCRDYFRKLGELFDLYTSPANLVGGSPKYPLPAIVAKQLGSFCKYLSVGIIPDPIKHCARRGHPLGPDELRDVKAAVTYVLAAKTGSIRDRHPVETIVREYGLSNRNTVQTWIVKHRMTAVLGNPADPELIKDRMMEAAERYRKSGRHHNAIRERASKKTAARRCQP